MSKTPNHFFCSQKFTWLSVDLEKRLLYSCCSAMPEKIDLKWLQQNPGRLFHTENLQRERQQMFDNIPVESCGPACWEPESKGLESRRTNFKQYSILHLDKENAEPKDLGIILGSTCNLTCSYCNKQYSSAWLRDVKDNGTYLEEDRFNLTPLDLITSKLSQNEHQSSTGYQLLLSEITKYQNLERILISGGEPFLYNHFPELLNSFDAEIEFFTGLGVNTKRLEAQLNRINFNDKIKAMVSAENCGRFYEFNRYSNRFDDFITNLKILQQRTVINFSSVISNLTIHGLVEFTETFGEENIRYKFCNDPDYLAINVMDDETKDSLVESITKSNMTIKDSILSTMLQPCLESQRQKFSSFIKEYAKRRNLNLDIYPISMLKWLELI